MFYGGKTKLKNNTGANREVDARVHAGFDLLAT
jgi:hypothetical protein